MQERVLRQGVSNLFIQTETEIASIALILHITCFDASEKGASVTSTYHRAFGLNDADMHIKASP